MAVCIKRVSLKREAVNKIITDLTVKPTEKWMMNDYGKKVKREGKPVQSYLLDEDNLVRVPFWYGHSHFGLNNDHLTHECIPDPQIIIPPYEYQRNIINKVINELSLKRTALLEAPPGSGKTSMSIMISTLIKKRTIVLLQNMVLVNQWKKAINTFTNLRCWVVGDELFPSRGTDIIICHIQRWNKIDKYMRSTVGFMIIDECPLHCNTKGITAILNFTPQYILSLSATPSRSRDGMFKIMDLIVDTRKITTGITIKFDVLRFYTEYVPIRGNQSSMWTNVVQSLGENQYRNRYLIEIAKSMCKNGYKVMMLTREIDHVKILEAMMADSGLTYDSFYGHKKTYNNAQVMIANVAKASVGFDEAGEACIGFDGVRISCVILCMSIASSENIIQAAGRSWRSIEKKPLVIHIVDNDEMLIKHWDNATQAYSGHTYDASITVVRKVPDPK